MLVFSLLFFSALSMESLPIRYSNEIKSPKHLFMFPDNDFSCSISPWLKRVPSHFGADGMKFMALSMFVY